MLVVDDEPLVCDSVKRMLMSYGHEVEVATSAREGLALFDKGPFDLVIIDYLMPEMKGDEMAAIIKARAVNQPVVIITAAVEMLQTAKHPLTGVDSIITKPFQLEELRDAVAGVLARHSSP
jgi:DNA-binding response OmpR family regulator